LGNHSNQVVEWGTCEKGKFGSFKFVPKFAFMLAQKNYSLKVVKTRQRMYITIATRGWSLLGNGDRIVSI